MFTDLLPARSRRLASARPFLINSSMTFSNILVPRNENLSEKRKENPVETQEFVSKKNCFRRNELRPDM